MSAGCPFGAGPRCWDCDGSCWYPEPAPPEPTAEEYCAGTGHPIYGEQDGLARCYCGTRTAPAPARDRADDGNQR